MLDKGTLSPKDGNGIKGNTHSCKESLQIYETIKILG